MLRTLKFAGVQIALVAMLLRALLPVGWMPDTAANADTPFVICSMNGAVSAAHHEDTGKHQPSHDDNRQNDICPFAASVHLATPTATASVAPSTQIASFEAVQSPARIRHDTSHYALQSPRAPPSLV